jgi:hypothetical protein
MAEAAPMPMNARNMKDRVRSGQVTSDLLGVESRINPMIEQILPRSRSRLSLQRHGFRCCKSSRDICAQDLDPSHFNPVSFNCGRKPLISRGEGESQGTCPQHQPFIGPQRCRLSDRVRLIFFLSRPQFH